MWGGSGPFLFDGASIEVGFVPVERTANVVSDIIDYVITLRRRRR